MLDLQTLTQEFELPGTHTALLSRAVAEATSMVWDMLTLVPPAILCTPEKFSEDWHEVVSTPRVKGSHYTLSYYRPLMLYHAHGHVAVKAIVGKKTSTEPTVNPESESESEGGDLLRLKIILLSTSVVTYSFPEEQSDDSDSSSDCSKCSSFKVRVDVNGTANNSLALKSFS